MGLLSESSDFQRMKTLFACIFVAISLHIANGEDRPTFTGAGKLISWQSAKIRCQNADKRLCLRKDMCRKGSASLSLKRTITIPRRDVWVAVLDEYNDWMYIGPNQNRRCQKLSETDGPPHWGGKNCSDHRSGNQDRKIETFCSSAKGFFCCQKEESLEEPVPNPVPVYIRSRMEDETPYYSFSLKPYRNEKDWFSDKASWRKGGRLDGDVTKMSLMSGRVENEFEDPIFFCIRSFTTSSRLYTTLHKVSKKWCSYPWKTNFYLYGAYTEPIPVNHQKYLIGMAGFGPALNSRISVQESVIFDVTFNIYGPNDVKNNKMYMQHAPVINDNACNNETEVLTSRSGLINSPNYPSRYNKGTKRNIACKWKIDAEAGSVVRIVFKTIKLSGEINKPFPKLQFRSFQGRRVSNYNFEKVCPTDRVDISGYGTFCGSRLPPRFTTTDDEVDISFFGTRESSGISFALFYEIIAPPNGLVVTKIPEENLGSFTWTSARKSCDIQRKTLCSANDICSLDSRPFYGVKQGDHWVPISDEYNDWIQVGRGNVHTCRRHNTAYGPPVWGILEGTCQGINMSRACPKRELLYCCDSKFSETTSSNSVTVSIYSTVQNGVVFFKYLRRGIDNRPNSPSIWTLSRKLRGDFTSLKLRASYAPGFEKVVYFCSLDLIPAIGRLKSAYAMLLQPCETRGWKFKYHLYALNQRETGVQKLYVGVYEKWPYHTRVHFRTFPEGFESDRGYILYSFGTRNIPSDQDMITEIEDFACNGKTTIITAPSVLESPGYPLSYENNANCRWQIRLPESSPRKGNRLKVTIEDLSLEDPVDVLSIYEVASSIDMSKSAADEGNVKIFKNRKDFTGMVSQASLDTSDSFLMVFKTDDSIADKGFKIIAEILAGDCGGDVTKHGDVITSPYYPMPYTGDSACKWTIKAPTVRYNIELEVQNFDLLPDENCSDSIRITGAKSGIRLFCGGAIPPKRILFNEQIVHLTFNSSSSDNFKMIKRGKGFAFKILFTTNNTEETPGGNAMPQCGVQGVPFDMKDVASDRIVGGLVAKNGNFPWLVMIGRPSVTCGGSLISDRWVLTATHCFVTQYMAALGLMVMHAPISQFTVIAGRYLRNIPSPGEQVSSVTQIVVHGGFQRYSARWTHTSGVRVIGIFPYNDITMAKLSKRINFSPTVSPACLPTQDAHVGDFCYVAGWGSRSADNLNLTSALNFAKVPILDNSLCNSWKELKGTIMKNALCAGFPQGGTDHCWGDSGGSLMCRGTYGNFYINGIVSWSRGCGGRRTPGIYTRVWNFMDWIKKVLDKDS